MSDPITFDVVRIYDPALATANDAAKIGEYAVKRDLSLLTVPPETTVYHCRALSRDQWRTVRELSSDSAQYELAFRYGVVELRGLERNGQRESVLVPRKNPRDALTDDDLDRLGVAAIDVEEVGCVIRTRSFLAPRLPRDYPVLPSSQSAAVSEVVHHAELSKVSTTEPDAG